MEPDYRFDSFPDALASLVSTLLTRKIENLGLQWHRAVSGILLRLRVVFPAKAYYIDMFWRNFGRTLPRLKAGVAWSKF